MASWTDVGLVGTEWQHIEPRYAVGCSHQLQEMLSCFIELWRAYLSQPWVSISLGGQQQGNVAKRDGVEVHYGKIGKYAAWW